MDLSSFNDTLAEELTQISNASLRRELRRIDSPQGRTIEIGGRTLLNFSSNDYLGLANHPLLKEAALKTIEKWGAGAGASRLICGSLAPYHDLEEILAHFKGTEAALTFSSGYAAALGTITALVGKDDIIVLDKLVHASIVDAARLSGAKLRVFKHNDIDDLNAILTWARLQPATANARPRRILVVTESVFSMDGDLAPLRDIVAAKVKHGAWLMVDEAHATGLFGPNRSGLAEDLAVSRQVEIQMGTLGKAIGSAGGYICGSRTLIDLLINRARSFIFSTAAPPAQAAAATAGIQLILSSEGELRRAAVWKYLGQLSRSLSLPAPHSAIVPIIVGDEKLAVSRASQLREAGFFVPAIRYPTVARGSARLRLTASANHLPGDILHLTQALAPDSSSGGVDEPISRLP